jgi:NAD(P)H-dependent flavin oxidoreductase YrpB (nitropropane dioxygenase family)
MKTKRTELFGIEHPTIQGIMHHEGFAELVNDIPTVQDLINNIMSQADEIIKSRMQNF